MSESNVLLDEEVLTDPKIQALLLTVLVSIFFLAVEIIILEVTILSEATSLFIELMQG